MTAKPFVDSDEWLTDPLVWDDAIEVHFIPGVRVLIKERKVIQWDDKPRHGFNIWIGDNPQSHSAVIVVEHPDKTVMICSDHDDECQCKKIVRQWMAL